MVRFLGYFNALLLVILSMRAPFMAWFKRSKKPQWAKSLARLIRRMHPVMGGILMATGISHGYLAWGWNFRHTGYLLYLFVLLQGILGIGLIKGEKRLKNFHRLVSLIMLMLLGLHIFYRSALS